MTALAPTPLGDVRLAFMQGAGTGVAMTLSVPDGAAAMACFPPLATGGAGDQLLVDGSAVEAVLWGRLLCVAADLAPGEHRVQRLAAAGA